MSVEAAWSLFATRNGIRAIRHVDFWPDFLAGPLDCFCTSAHFMPNVQFCIENVRKVDCFPDNRSQRGTAEKQGVSRWDCRATLAVGPQGLAADGLARWRRFARHQ